MHSAWGGRRRGVGVCPAASPAGTIVINALFTLKVSLLVLQLNLDPPGRLRTQSLCDPKAIPLQMPSSEDGLKLGSCLQCVWQQPMCLYLLSNLQAFICLYDCHGD